MSNANSAAQPGKGYYLRRMLRQMPEVAAISGHSLASLYLKYGLFHIFEGMDFEDFRALRMYEYTRPRRRDFLLTRDTLRFSDRLNAGASPEEVALLDNKYLFDRTFRAFIRRDWLYMPEASEQDLRAFLAKNPVFLAKACISNQGKGIVRHTARDTDPQALLAAYGGKPYVLEAFIAQHPLMAALNPPTVNTVRIQTARRDDEVIVLGGCLRCGGADAFVDNFHQGGVAYPLDMDTGVVVGPGRKLTGAYVRRHPSTGRFMPGFQVPLWDALIQAVKTAAVTVPHVGYIGWDVAVTPDGPELVEGNINYPDSIVVQLDGQGCYRQLRDFVEGT